MGGHRRPHRRPLLDPHRRRINHWYHADLTYRAAITALLVTGCVGKNGGGLNHYVGQEKLAPVAPWATLAGALDWGGRRGSRTPSFHYVHCDQWRYERTAEEKQLNPTPGDGPPSPGTRSTTRSARCAAAGCRSSRSSSGTLDVAGARAAGALADGDVVGAVERQLKGKLRLSVEDPDAEENWPRVFLIWRGNALSSSAKGQEYFLRHYLGTDDASVAKETAKGSTSEVWRDGAPKESSTSSST